MIRYAVDAIAVTRTTHNAAQLNYIHRMTARVSFLLIWVHVGGKASVAPASLRLAQLTFPSSQLPFFVHYPTIWQVWYIRVGLTALVAATLLLIVSLRPIRARAYEVFYFAHFLLVLCVPLVRVAICPAC